MVQDFFSFFVFPFSIRRYRSDGLNNLKYKLEERVGARLYTNLTVQLEHTEYSQKYKVGGPGKTFNKYIHQISKGGTH